MPTLPEHVGYLDDAGAAQIDLDGAHALIEDSLRAVLAEIRRLHAETVVSDEITHAHTRILVHVSRGITAKEIARIAAGNIAVACLEIRRLPLALSQRSVQRAARASEAAA